MPTPAQNLSMQRRGMRSQFDNGNPETVDNVRRDFYIYEAQCTALAVGASANDSILIEADSEFILQKLAVLATNGAGTTIQATPLLLIQITDTGSGRQLMSAPIPVPNFFGNGQLPFILPNPRLFMRNSTIQVAFTSIDTVNTITARLSFIGYKIYNKA